MSTRRTLLITSLIAAVGVALVVPNAAFSRGTPESSMNNFTNYITSNMIKNNSITSNDIKNLSIKVDDLSNRIITNEKIIPGAVKLDTLDAEVMAKVQTMIDATVAAKIASLSIPAAPRAYGRVKADGSVDTNVSSGLSARKSGNKYCVSVTGVTDPTKITPVVTASNNSIAAYAVVTSLANCNSNEFGVGVYFSSVDEAAPFNVYVP
jgi:hypothetical protein